MARETLTKCHFVYHKSHVTCLGLEPGLPQWESRDCLSYGVAFKQITTLFVSWLVSFDNMARQAVDLLVS
jgi:hypothetical protein